MFEVRKSFQPIVSSSKRGKNDNNGIRLCFVRKVKESFPQASRTARQVEEVDIHRYRAPTGFSSTRGLSGNWQSKELSLICRYLSIADVVIKEDSPLGTKSANA